MHVTETVLSISLAAMLMACGGGDSGTTPISSTSSSAASAASVPAAQEAPASAVTSASAVSATSAASAVDTASASASPPEATPEVATTNPVAAAFRPGSIFYGVNGHVVRWGPYTATSVQTQLAQLKDLGITVYRNDVSDQTNATILAGVAHTMARSRVMVYPVILQGINFPDENAAYQAAYAQARAIVSVRRYPYYEVTNELAEQCLVGWVDGVRNTDFDNAKYQIARGVIRGMIAGIKSIDPTGKIIMGGNTWMHYAFDVMLARGTQPDGTSGHPNVPWDITAWHWYSEQGDITHACGGTGCYNVIGVLKSLGAPIWINETGVRPTFPGTQQQAGAFLANNMVGRMLALASQYNIQSVQVYELYDDPPGGEGPYGVIQNDGKTLKPAYTALKNFIAAHPK